MFEAYDIFETGAVKHDWLKELPTGRRKDIIDLIQEAISRKCFDNRYVKACPKCGSKNISTFENIQSCEEELCNWYSGIY